MKATTWKEKLNDKISQAEHDEIDGFSFELDLKKQGKVDDKVFMESRGRRGIYGQRYDNMLRHDGKKEIKLQFPGDATKGPGIHWHAPGMQRIKVPQGVLTFEQLEVLAQLAEEYSDSIIHVTTRQDIQLHFIHIEDTPDLFRRLSSVSLTSKEACGNSVRNVTSCVKSGVCKTEIFDVTPYSKMVTDYFLGHPGIQDFGRKFKISFSGCVGESCALAGMHDLGFVAKIREVDGVQERGFEMLVGGGLGAVPYHARVLEEFVSEKDLLPLTLSVFRVFAKHGEKNKRSKARIKFLVKNWGIEKFHEEMLKERTLLKEDPKWNEFLNLAINAIKEVPLKKASKVALSSDSKYNAWLSTNVNEQSQEGFYMVDISLPLGDLSASQARALIDICKKYVRGSIRTSIQQNFLLRWIAGSDLESVFKDLGAIDLADAGANTIKDITSCPGTDTCKLGVAASRGLAEVLTNTLDTKDVFKKAEAAKLRVKISGCMNSCAMHHIADIGFFGTNRLAGDYVVPHFQMVLGGNADNNISAYGLPIASIPSKSVPAALESLVDYYVDNKEETESFQDFVSRVGKPALKERLEEFRKIPDYLVDKSYYVDWGDVREYSTSDKGIGECSGEVISLTGMGLKDADREVFEAQVALDEKKTVDASKKAYGSMITAARSLLKELNPSIGNDAAEIIQLFKKNVAEGELFLEQIASYLLTYDEVVAQKDNEAVHQSIEEAQLFIEECYAFDIKRKQRG